MNWTQRDGRGVARGDAAAAEQGGTAASLASRASRLASLRKRRFDGARSVIEKRHKVRPRNGEAERDREQRG